MNFAISSGNLEFIIAIGEGVATVVQAIPQHGVGAGQVVGRAGQYTIGQFGWIKIHAITADDDFIGLGIFGLKREFTTTGNRAGIAAEITHKAGIDQHRWLGYSRNAMLVKHYLDLGCSAARRVNLAEEYRKLRRLRGNACIKVWPRIDWIIIATNIFVEWRAVRIYESFRIGIKCCPIGIQAVQGFLVAVAINGHHVQLVVQITLIAAKANCPRIGKHPAVQIVERLLITANRHIPDGHIILDSLGVVYRSRIAVAARACTGKEHAVNAGLWRFIPARFITVGNRIAAISAVWSGQLGGAVGNLATSWLISQAFKIRIARNGFIPRTAE